MNDLAGSAVIAMLLLIVILASFHRPRATGRRCIRCGKPAAHGDYCVGCLVND